MRLFVLVFVILVGEKTLAVDENQFHFLFEQVVEPFYESGQQGRLVRDGVHLTHWYREIESAHEKARVVFLSGRTEPMMKYKELYYDLHNQGYSIYTFDHRGQGQSERLLQNPEIGWVRNFEDYVLDLEQFIDERVDPEGNASVYLIGHSMGGAIAAAYALKHPDRLAGLVLSSAMIMPHTGKYPAWVAYGIANAGIFIGMGRKFLPGEGEFEHDQLGAPSRSSHSIQRVDEARKMLLEYPETVLGGASYNWLRVSVKNGHQLLRRAQQLKVPVLMLTAGRDDWVRQPEQERFCRQAVRCRQIIFTDSYHEIFQEQDAIRGVALAHVFEFMEEPAMAMHKRQQTSLE